MSPVGFFRCMIWSFEDWDWDIRGKGQQDYLLHHFPMYLRIIYHGARRISKKISLKCVHALQTELEFGIWFLMRKETRREPAMQNSTHI